DTRWSYPIKVVRIGSGGAIYLAGMCGVSKEADHWYPYQGLCAARFSADGQVDRSFGNHSGVAAYQVGKYSFATDLELLPDGRIILSGGVGAYGTGWAILRLAADGKSSEVLEPRFTRQAGQPGAPSVEVAAGGKVVAAGARGLATDAGAKDQHRLTITRTAQDGTLDASFAGGSVDPLPPDAISGATSVVLTPDGGILAAGVSFSASDWNARRLVLVKVWQ
ncbi:MAG TPA: hypothetical protein VNT60_07775, partial [Deinococcales bacterium]|nr:hypothetical protein [Deinococcales bacterium]